MDFLTQHVAVFLSPPAIEPFLGDVDLVLVMTVEPGFGGQGFLTDTLPKISRLRRVIEQVNPTMAFALAAAAYN